jgi:hypothetical protein
MSTMKNTKKRFTKTKIITVIFLLILLGVLFFNLLPKIGVKTANGSVVYNPSTSSHSSANTPAVRDELKEYLVQQQIVKDLPKDAIILLKTYRIENNEWVYEKNYVIKKGSVSIGTTKTPDIIIYLYSGFIAEEDFCVSIKNALNNGQMSYESMKSDLSLLIKYSGMLKYKNCLS